MEHTETPRSKNNYEEDDPHKLWRQETSDTLSRGQIEGQSTQEAYYPWKGVLNSMDLYQFSDIVIDRNMLFWTDLKNKPIISYSVFSTFSVLWQPA